MSDILKKEIEQIHEKCLKIRVNKGDILLLLKILYEEEIGRYRLIEKTGLSEATIRSLLNHLRKMEYIKRKYKGHTLNNKGIMLIKEYLKIVKNENYIVTPFRIGAYNYYIHITGISPKIKSGIEQRDIAILAGGKGAITLMYHDGKLIFPDSKDDASQYYPEFIREVISDSNPTEGDIIIITGADDKIKARSVAYEVLLSLL